MFWRKGPADMTRNMAATKGMVPELIVLSGAQRFNQYPPVRSAEHTKPQQFSSQGAGQTETLVDFFFFGLIYSERLLHLVSVKKSRPEEDQRKKTRISPAIDQKKPEIEDQKKPEKEGQKKPETEDQNKPEIVDQKKPETEDQKKQEIEDQKKTNERKPEYVQRSKTRKSQRQKTRRSQRQNTRRSQRQKTRRSQRQKIRRSQR